MAKLGEGDPRWIVSEREDGTNPNGWHWEEINKLSFAKDFFSARFLSLRSNEDFSKMIDRKCLKCECLNVVEVSGDCSVSTRKGGKKFGVFDLKVVVQFECELECLKKKTEKKKKKKEENVDGLDGDDDEEDEDDGEKMEKVQARGEITITEFSSLNDPDEYEWQVKMTAGDDDAKKIVQSWFTRKTMENMFGNELEKFIEEMNEFCL